MKKENEEEKSDYLQSFNSSSFSFALKLSSDRSSLIVPGSSFQTLAPATGIGIFPFSVIVKLTRKLFLVAYLVR